MLNGYSGIRTRNFGLCLPSLLVGQTMTGQSWTGSLDECPDPQLDMSYGKVLKMLRKKGQLVSVYELWKFFKTLRKKGQLVSVYKLWKIFKNAKKKRAIGLCIWAMEKFEETLRKKGQLVSVYELWKNLKKR